MLNLFLLSSLEAMMLPVEKPQPLGRLIKSRNYLCTMLYFLLELVRVFEWERGGSCKFSVCPAQIQA